MPRWMSWLLRDEDDKIAECGVWLPDNLSFAQYDAIAAAIGQRLSAISDALVIQAELKIRYTFTSAAPQAGTINRNKLFLFYRNGEEYYNVVVPGAKSTLPYDVVGPYRTIRLQREAVSLSGLLATIENISANTVYRNGDNPPTVFEVGARTRSNG